MNGQTYGREVAFNQTVINIGADSGNDIILKGESVADFHAMLHFENERWFIVSLDPSKTTNVNGHILGDLAENLQNSSVVTIGDYRLFFNLNGVNADIMIQSQGIMSEGASVQTEAFGSNILLEITNSTMTEIEAGATAEFELTVTNAGPLVANMQLQLQGVPTSWVQVIPPVLNLNEGRKGIFSVRISPPRDSSAEAGFYGLHFVASSPNYQQETGIADSSLTVLPYSEFLASGPTPRRLELTRKNQTDLTDVVILNNSNAATTFFVRSYDDANDLFFTYEREGSSQQGQETITIRPGDNTRVSMRIGSRKLPILGMRSHSYHYNTTITPSDQPGGGQSLMGEVVVKPLINTFWVLLTLILLVVGAIVFFQPRIRHFDGDNGKRTLVALYGNPVRINWDVVPFASKVTMTDNSGEPQDMIKSGSQFIAPKVSSTYTLKAENIFSKMFNINYEKTIQVLVIPQSPTVSTLHTDISDALYNQQVTLNWAVSGDISKAALAYNKQKTDLTAENYTGTLAQGYTSDTLFSLKAQNNSGYDMRSLFLNVAPDRIDLKRFTVWVRPNGIAVPNNNDTRRTSRWSSLQLTADTNTSGIIRPAVNPMPEPQTNVLSIPDNYNNIGNSQGLNPEQIALSGQLNPNNGYVYSSPQVDVDNPELLVSPSLRPTVMPTAIPEAVLQTGPIVRETTVPPTSPEAAPYNRDFSVKLVEVVEDPLSESGYRIIDYFPDYQLQPKEQILVEWSVNGVSAVKITGLSGDSLRASGGDFAYPEKSLTYELEAEVGQVKKVYSLPVRVAGDADDGEGSGLKCELKANATTLKEPGSVMLSWTGGGTNRVQLVSSAKAEQDSEDAEKKKEQEAKEKGETYKKPSQPAQMTGGTIGDWLQPSGFMRVNVEKQTTFVLNAYDGNGNVICTKSVDVKLEGGNDKEDISKIPGASFKIVKIADDNDVSQPFYTVGQTVHYTIAMTGFPKGKEPSGSVVITDGTGSCTVTLPVTSCSFVAKKAGNLTVTAVYSGDNTYKKAQATAKERVINKLPTTLEIQAAFKPGATLADVISQLKFDAENEYGLIPTGVITFTVGSGTCDLDVMTDKLTCEGKAVENPDDGYWWTITNMVLTDSNADRITAVYKGDNYFSPSTAKPVLFYKIPTKTVISDAYKPGETKADFDTTISWSLPWEEKDAVYKLAKNLKPTGTITFTPMASTSSSGSASSETTNCVYDITAKSLSCEGTPDQTIGQDNILVSVREMLVTNTSDRIRAVYSGDSFFNTSSHTLLFYTIPTTTEIASAVMAPDMWITLKDVMVVPNPGPNPPTDKRVTGTLTFRSGAGSSSNTQGGENTSVGYTAVPCIFDIGKETFQNCMGEITGTIYKESDKYQVKEMRIRMDGTPGETIMADYSGDSVYLKSSSQTVEISKTPKLDTEITIETASKNGDLIRLTAVLDPADGPTGKITLKSGSAVCNLTIDNRNSLFFEDCSGQAKYDPVSKKFIITDMVMNGTPGENIRAEYSGDAVYNKSISTPISFVRKDTKITIEAGAEKVKTTVDEKEVYQINLTTVLEPAEGPTGEITFTSGSATCVLDIDDRNAPAFLDSCTGKAEFKNGKFVITDMVMDETPGSTIRAEYSGDGAYYGSVSPEVAFTSSDKIDTELVLQDVSKSGELLADFAVILSFDKAKADGNTPTGTINFTIGNDTCQLNVVSNDFDCMGESTVITGPLVTEPGTDVRYHWSFEKVPLSDSEAKSVSAVYNGDTNFNPSVADEVEFIIVDTVLEITDAFKKPKSEYVDTTLNLTWDDTPPAGKLPTGTITLTSGAETCTLDISTKEFKDCSIFYRDDEDPEIDPKIKLTFDDKKLTIEITDLDMGSQTGTTISAKYSGDGTFLASSAADFTFRKIPTILKIEKALKPGSLYLNLSDLLLSWNNTESENIAPTGTIKLTIGSDTCELTFDNKPDDGDFTKFTCWETGVTEITPSSEGPDPEETDPDKKNDKIIHWLMQKILLSNGTTADRVKADYSGDDIFDASSCDFVLFSKVNTTLKIIEKDTPRMPYKYETTYANIGGSLSWTDDPAWISLGCSDPKTNCPTPTGTIKYTIRSDDPAHNGDVVIGTCVLDIVKKSMDCEPGTADISDITPGMDTMDFTVIHMLLASKEADRVKLEYSGDSFYNASESTAVLFYEDKKIDTTLEIKTARKTDNGIDLTAKLLPVGTETGTIVFTSGSATCTININEHDDVKFEKCSGKADYKSDGTIEIHAMVMDGTPGDSIYAEYSGDTNYNKSSSPLYSFKKINTTLEVRNAYKSETIRAFYDAVLGWETKNTDNRKPTGTITFTIGDTCKMVFSLTDNDIAKTDVDDPYKPIEFSCSDDKTKILMNKDDSTGTDTPSHQRIWSFKDVLLAVGNSADRIKAEYSGDAVFNPSTSEFLLLDTIPTTLEIENESKTGSGLVDVDAVLSWTDEPLQAGKVPSGTIKFTMGSAVCTLDISKETPVFTDCESDPVPAPADAAGSKTKTYHITNLKFADVTGTEIKAEYSGDGLFLPSASSVKSFDKYDTELDIEKAKKAGTSYADLNTLLTWNKTEAGAKVPTGTITFTIGSDSCKLTFDGSDGNVKDFTCMEKNTTKIKPSPSTSPDESDPTIEWETITWEMLNIMLSSGSTADRVKAEYSGDANFNPSTTEFVLFESIPTEMKIIRMYQDFEPGEYYIILQLSWTEEPSESGRIPTGTINLKVGDKVCPLRLTGTTIHSDICNVYGIDGVPSGKIWQFTLHELEMGKISKNSASTEYLGDNLFRASKYEHKVDTQTDIDSARMMPDGTVAITFMQKWDQFLAGMERFDHNDYAFRPSGTFKITVGASSCTMQLKGTADPVFTDCDVRAAKLEYVGSNIREVYPKYTIEGLKIGDGTADGIKVEYSGDDLFNPSSSKTKYFDKADTVITVSKAFKSGDIRANWTSVLSWDPAAVGTDVPIGVITFAVGSDSCKLTLDPIKGTETNPKKQTNFTCADSTTEVWLDQGTAGQYTLTFTNVLLTAGNTPDRIKADYAGDALFNASASDFLLFETIPTTTTLGIGLDKTPAGLVNADITLRWESTPLAVGTPQGTIKLTSGSAACTLDLAANPVRFTDCSSNTVTVTPGDKQLTFTVKNLNMGAGAGEDLKAEYSGSGSFLASASDKLSFTKVPTALVINSAYKPGDPGLANLVSTLSWDAEKAYTRKPTGTVKFTAGGNICELNLATRILTCGSKPVADWDRTGSNYRMVIEEMLLSDTSAARIKAEYSGDAVFNPSTAETVLFKTVDTEISVAAASKFDAQHATVSALLDWDESIADGRKPTGTVKFVIGSSSCELTIETGKLSCEPGTGTVSEDRKNYKGTNMLVEDTSADRVSVEYSGDGFFNPSTSTKVLFDRVDTTIKVNKAYWYKKGIGIDPFMWLESLLSWDESEAQGRKPTGTIKISVGANNPEYELSARIAEYDLTAKTLKINGEQIESPNTIVDSSESPERLVFKDLPFDATTFISSADKIEYSGDLYFGPSSAPIVYDKLPTAVQVDGVSFSKNGGQYNFSLGVRVKKIASILNDASFTGDLKTEITFNYRYYGYSFTVTCQNVTCEGIDGGGSTANYDRNTGIFELNIYAANLKVSYESPRSITIKASYNGTEDLLYESSDTSYTYTSQLNSWIENIEAIQLSNGEKYIAFDLKFTGFQSNGTGNGSVEFVTSNGKTCSVSFDRYSTHIEDNDKCKGVIDIADGSHGSKPGGSGTQVDSWFVKKWTLKGVKFDPDEADKIYINFLGSYHDEYTEHSGAYGESTFINPTETTLAISEIKNTADGEVNMSLSLQYTPKSLSNNYWPGGPLVITKGGYTCTVPLEFSKTERYSASLLSDCGGGTADVWSLTEGRLIIELKGLPITDQTSNTVKAEYMGDWSNKKSEPVTGNLVGKVSSITEGRFTLTYDDEDSRPKLTTTIKTTEEGTTSFPTGKITYKFDQTGNECSVTISKDEQGKAVVDHVSGSCGLLETSSSPSDFTASSSTYEIKFSSIDLSDTKVTISYEGDSQYKPSTDEVRVALYGVAITPVTDNIYSEGRLYFNTGSGTVYYPYYPERYGSNAYSYCQQYPTPSDCHQLAYEFQLKVIVTQPEDSNIDMTGETITFSNGDMSPNSVTCNLISVEGGFGCTTDTKVHFTKTGNKTIKARYAGNSSKMLASANADFPVMIALSLTGEKTASFTDFVFAEGEATQFTAGETRTMKAKSFEYGNEGNPVSDPSYVFYTYNRSENRRVKTCTGYGCSLEITADADVVIVEFPGNDSFAPSMMEKTIIKPETGSPVSLDVTIGGE